MLKFHFQIQKNRFKRWSHSLGFNAILLIILGTLGFYFLSILLFHKIESAQWIYIFIALSIVSSSRSREKKAFLNQLLMKYDIIRVFLAEALLISAPFIIFLIYKHHFVPAIICLILCLLSIFIPPHIYKMKAFNNPFSKMPFEFTTGIRKTIVLYILNLILTGIAIYVDNVNLGYFSLFVTGLIAMSYYYYFEAYWYIWVFNSNEKKFLNQKIRIGLIHTSIIALPQCFLLSIFYPEQIFQLSICFSILILYVLLAICGKYAFYPLEVPLPQSLALALSILFPPLLIFLIPYFYKKSLDNLKPILLC